jgi:hypothetical protein
VAPCWTLATGTGSEQPDRDRHGSLAMPHITVVIAILLAMLSNTVGAPVPCGPGSASSDPADHVVMMVLDQVEHRV